MSKQQCTLRVSGMICPQCEDEILPTLLHTRGVIDADASYRKSSVTISYDDRIIHADQFPEILAACGYPVGGGGKDGVRSDLISSAAVVFLLLLFQAVNGLIKAPAFSLEAGESISVIALFFTGLLSGVHCIAMCGGIMLTQKKVFVYNGARLLGCTLAGAVFGFAGSGLMYDASTASMIKTISGLLVLLTGLNRWGIPMIRNLSLQLRLPCRTPGKSALAVGFLNSFMPCGMLTSVWLIAAASGSWLRGAVCMFAFCLGTFPCMFLFGSLGRFLPKKYNRFLLRGSTVIVVALGIRLVILGLSG